MVNPCLQNEYNPCRLNSCNISLPLSCPSTYKQGYQLGNSREILDSLSCFHLWPNPQLSMLLMYSVGLVSSLLTHASMSFCKETFLFHFFCRCCWNVQYFRIKAERSLTCFHSALPCHLQMLKSHHSGEWLGCNVEHCLGIWRIAKNAKNQKSISQIEQLWNVFSRISTKEPHTTNFGLKTVWSSKAGGKGLIAHAVGINATTRDQGRC